MHWWHIIHYLATSTVINISFFLFFLCLCFFRGGGAENHKYSVRTHVPSLSSWPSLVIMTIIWQCPNFSCGTAPIIWLFLGTMNGYDHTQARQRFAGCWLVRSRPWKEKGGTHRERSLLASCLAWLLSSNPCNLQAIQPVWLKFPDKGQSTFIHHPAPKFCHYNPISSGLEGLPREGRHQQKSWGRRMRWD